MFFPLIETVVVVPQSQTTAERATLSFGTRVSETRAGLGAQKERLFPNRRQSSTGIDMHGICSPLVSLGQLAIRTITLPI